MQSDGKTDTGDARPTQAEFSAVSILDMGEIFRHAHGSGGGGPTRYRWGINSCGISAAGIP
jgi:hypothetical protein